MIKLLHVKKIFNKDFYALNDINIQIKKATLTLLKGPSGSGKSTILSLIAGLCKPTSGDVIVNEQSISKLPDEFASVFRRENIGFIFQKFNLIEDLSVEENIILTLIPKNLDESYIQKKCDSLLAKFNLSDKKSMLVKSLSGGEQQRVVIARALINDPDIILADEPTANLDENLSNDFVNILKLLKQEGKTIIVATHDALFFDLDIVDECIELHKGVLV